MPFDELMAGIESLATTVAIGVGGVWTYVKFIKRREGQPRASIEHQCTVTTLPDGQKLLHVNVDVTNAGDVLLSLTEIITRVQQILPLDPRLSDRISQDEDLVPEGGTEVPWPTLGRRDWRGEDSHLEPGESERYPAEFLIAEPITRVLIYTWIRNPTKDDMGWNITSIMDVSKGG